MIRLVLPLFGLVFGWMSGLAPDVDHYALAWAIASQVHGAAEAALVTAIAFRESTFDNAAIGDHGRSFCALQIHASSGGTVALTEDVGACVAAGLAILRQSVRVDRAHPVAFYARGPRWEGLEARRLSDDRVRIAKGLLAL